MWFIYLFEEIFGKIVFSIGEYEFAGIRPVRYVELPWKNRKEMKKYMKELELENTPYSYKKFIRWEEEMQFQKIHINFSRSLLCLVTSSILLLLSGLLLLKENVTISIFILTISILMFIYSLILKLRARKIYKSIGLGRIIYDQFETWPE